MTRIKSRPMAHAEDRSSDDNMEEEEEKVDSTDDNMKEEEKEDSPDDNLEKKDEKEDSTNDNMEDKEKEDSTDDNLEEKEDSPEDNMKEEEKVDSTDDNMEKKDEKEDSTNDNMEEKENSQNDNMDGKEDSPEDNMKEEEEEDSPDDNMKEELKEDTPDDNMKEEVKEDSPDDNMKEEVKEDSPDDNMKEEEEEDSPDDNMKEEVKEDTPDDNMKEEVKEDSPDDNMKEEVKEDSPDDNMKEEVKEDSPDDNMKEEEKEQTPDDNMEKEDSPDDHIEQAEEDSSDNHIEEEEKKNNSDDNMKEDSSDDHIEEEDSSDDHLEDSSDDHLEDSSDDNMEKEEEEMVMEEEALPEPQHGFHGVLRYRRESEWRQIGVVPTSISHHTVCCEFCGSKTKPPLDFSKTPNILDFCCAPYMEMFKKVEQQWRTLQESSPDFDYSMDNAQEFRDRAIIQDVRLQQVTDESKKSKRPTSGSKSVTPGCKVTSSGLFTTICFRLSDFLRTKVKDDRSDKEEPSSRPEPCTTSTSLPPGFGLCHHKGNIEKFYSCGGRFLTASPNGTTQVFYPSGNLAIMTFADDTEGVCIVLDDVQPSCPVRAFFRSSGIAVCYHSNGRTRLHIDPWGGQSLSEDGSKCKKWKWMDHAKKQTPFKPVYLSLNKHVGVQVRGRESVLVTFLASGEQARFRVGSCTEPDESAPPLCEEDLMLRVSQFNARAALERLRWCIEAQTDTKRWPLKLSPNLVTEGRRLLKLTPSVWLEEKHKAYVQSCLRDCR